jgi:hypothetical protein
MKPKDSHGSLPISERPFRVFVIAGSNRRQYNCPGVDSKARTLMLRMAGELPSDWEIDLEDLGNVFAREQIQSCNACVSTSMALCVWPCNCYRPGDKFEPDLMWNLDLYSRLDLADAWAFIAPVNWYGPSSNLKLMFDRLVCMNGGNPREDLIEHKNPELAMDLEHSEQWSELSVNHLEGRTAAFFCYGDAGGDEVGQDGRPESLRHKEYFDPALEPFANERDSYAPLVWQCRYSGIEVPNHLWRYVQFGESKKYSDNQSEHMIEDRDVIEGFDRWVADFKNFVSTKGKVEPGKYRAYGLKRKIDWRLEAKLGWRDVRLRLGMPPEGSSPQRQQQLGLNQDDTLFPQQSESERYYRRLEIERRLAEGRDDH